MPSQTIRASPTLLKTVVSGRVSDSDASDFIAAGLQNMPVPTWLFDGRTCQSYSPAAIDIAARGLLECKKHGLQRVVAVVPSAMLRMAVALVRMATKMDILAVGTMQEAERECRWTKNPTR